MEDIVEIKKMVKEIYDDWFSEDEEFFEEQEKLDYICTLECQLQAAFEEIERLQKKNKKLKERLKGNGLFGLR